MSVQIAFTTENVQDFTDAKTARAFLRSRGLSVKDFVKEGEAWTPNEAAAQVISTLDLTRHQTGASTDPAVIAAREQAKAEKDRLRAELAEKRAAEKATRDLAKETEKAAKAKEREDAKAEKKRLAEEAAATTEAAQSAKGRWDALTVDELMPDLQTQLDALATTLDGRALTQADVYNVIIDGAAFPEEMSQTDRAKVAKRLARAHFGK